MWDYATRENPFAEKASELKSLTLSNDATSVGDYAFRNTNLSYAHLFTNTELGKDSSKVSSLKTIGKYAFSGTKFESVTVPGSVTAIADGAFNDCSKLKSITIYNRDCTIADNAINNSSSGNGTYTGVICGYVNSTAHKYAKDHGYKFVPLDNQCGDDLYYEIDDNGVVNITGTGDMWDFVNGSLSVGKDKKSPFDNARADVTKVIMSDEVTSIGNAAFFGCSKLTDITISKNIKSIGENAFNGCSKLDNIHLPNSIESIGKNAFKDTEELKNQTWDKTGSIVKYVDNWAVGYDATCLTESKNGDLRAARYYVKFNQKTVGIADYAFEGLRYAMSFQLPNGLKYIGRFAFKDCNYLDSITLPKSIKRIFESAFECENLHSISVYHRDFKIDPNTFPPKNVNIILLSENDFIPERDGQSFVHGVNLGYGFETPNDASFMLSDEYREKLTLYPRFKSYVDSFLYNGSCFGITATMALCYNNTITPSQISNNYSNNYYGINRPSMNDKFSNIIKYYYLTQFDSDCNVVHYEYSLFDNTKFGSSLNQIVTYLKTEKAYGLSFKNSVVSGHTVLVQGLEYNEDDDCYVTHLYDMNYSCLRKMFIYGDYSDCYFYILDKQKNNQRIDKNALSELNLIDFEKVYQKFPLTDSDIKSEFVKNDKITKIVSSKSNNVTIENTKNEVLNIYNSEHNGDMEVLNSNYITDTTETAFDILNSEKFTIKNNSGSMYLDFFRNAPLSNNLRAINASITGTNNKSSNALYSINGDNIDTANVNFDNHKINCIGKNMKFKIYITSDSLINEIDEGLVSISAKSDENTTISAKNGVVTVNGDSVISDIEITSYVGNEEITRTIADTNEFEFNVTETGNIVFDGENKETTDDSSTSLTTNTSATTASTTTTSTTTITKPAEQIFKLGDVNEDGAVDASDASAVLAEYANLSTGGNGTFSEGQKLAADVNADSIVDATDASSILVFYSYLSTGGTETDMKVWLETK